MEQSEKTIVGRVVDETGFITKFSPYLRIISPKNLHHRVLLTEKPITIGRDPTADLQLDSHLVSRLHCRLWVDNLALVYLEDLNSTNGTRLDNLPVKNTLVTSRSRIQIGPFVLKIEYKNSDEIAQEEALFAAATTDPLTGLSNRKWFDERVNQMLQAINGTERQLSVVMVDIDHFKKINDSYGHQTGDAVIQGVARVLEHSKRQQDLICRYGGEEFVFCLPDINQENAVNFCERIRQQVIKTPFRFGKDVVNATVSIGVCSVKGQEKLSLTDIIGKADEALYASKNQGRNRVSIST